MMEIKISAILMLVMQGGKISDAVFDTDSDPTNDTNKDISNASGAAFDMHPVLNAKVEGTKSTAKASPTSEVIAASEETELTLDLPLLSSKKIDGNLPTRAIASYVDLVDMTGQNCCSYCYVLHLVDPIAHLGHVMILKSNSDDSLCTVFSKLMYLACFPPTTIYYDVNFTFIPSVASLYPRVVFTRQPRSDLMSKECSLFLTKLRKWIFFFWA